MKKVTKEVEHPLASSVVPLQLNLNSKAVTMDCLRRIVLKWISGGPLWSEGGKLMLLIIVIIRNKRSNIAGCCRPTTTALVTCWCTTSFSTRCRCRCRCRWSRWTGSYNTNDTITMILFASHKETKPITNLDICEAYHHKMKKQSWVLVKITMRSKVI